MGISFILIIRVLLNVGTFVTLSRRWGSGGVFCVYSGELRECRGRD